jgi:hypothetical protein
LYIHIRTCNEFLVIYIGSFDTPSTQPPNYLPTEATETTEVSDAKYSPTDCTDVHRLGGYGIPAIPS